MAAGNGESITVHTRTGAAVAITVTYPGGIALIGGTTSGPADIQGTFTDAWSVVSSAQSGTASVLVDISSGDQVASTSGTFRIYHPENGETCP